MCHGEISIPEIESLYKIDFRKHFSQTWTLLERFSEEGLVNLSSLKIELTPIGKLFTRNVAMTFDRHLKSTGTSNFSNTV
jgi:oxygen-independent coproporphyrinogen-3 oxidase